MSNETPAKKPRVVEESLRKQLAESNAKIQTLEKMLSEKDKDIDELFEQTSIKKRLKMESAKTQYIRYLERNLDHRDKDIIPDLLDALDEKEEAISDLLAKNTCLKQREVSKKGWQAAGAAVFFKLRETDEATETSESSESEEQETVKKPRALSSTSIGSGLGSPLVPRAPGRPS